MKKLPASCPICGGQIIVTSFHCRECDTSIEGNFNFHSFAQLSQQDLDFIETFMRCEGKINRMEKEMNLSYPTIRNRLHEVIRALGYEPGFEEEMEQLPQEKRQSILEDLEAGRISIDQALEQLQERDVK